MADASTTVGLPDNFQPDAERVLIALRASWESEACASTALELLREAGDGDDRIYVVRALLMRLRDMSEIVMGALNDSVDDVAGMVETLERGARHG